MTNPSINAALQDASESVTTDFQSWPKIPRLAKETMVITEKIDGTNGQILITPEGAMRVGSRNRWITPDDDNYGFATWCEENKGDILKLGPGRHFGEWYGSGIQRGYGLDHKRFALFNTFRLKETLPDCVSQVWPMYTGPVDTNRINQCLQALINYGSQSVPGWMKPEGVVVHYPSSKVRHKVLLENDGLHKDEVTTAAPHLIKPIKDKLGTQLLIASNK